MSKLFELGSEISSATPDRCTGCSHPDLLGRGLARKVLEEEISLDEAKETFNEDMEACLGRLRNITTDRTSCGRYETCTIPFVQASPESL